MNYKEGDKVICIDAMRARGSGKLVLVSAGQEYTVYGFCHGLVQLVGVYHPLNLDRCKVCRSQYGEFYPWRFIKIEPLKEEEKEKVEVLSK
jgi:hypothetical protein